VRARAAAEAAYVRRSTIYSATCRTRDDASERATRGEARRRTCEDGSRAGGRLAETTSSAHYRATSVARDGDDGWITRRRRNISAAMPAIGGVTRAGGRAGSCKTKYFTTKCDSENRIETGLN